MQGAFTRVAVGQAAQEDEQALNLGWALGAGDADFPDSALYDPARPHLLRPKVRA